MTQLNSIIAINSYVPKKINRYEVAGGCIVQGTNGAGKTSLLRLSLLFFGVKPNDIAIIAGKGNRFYDYYLKTNSSYVAFEYERLGKTLLVVVYAKMNGELGYRFLETAFDEQLFVDEVGQFVKTEQFKSHVQAKLGVRVGNEFSWSQYKDIIQSGIRKPMNTPNAAEINQAKVLYSLCEPNKTIGDVDRIMVSIISSKPSLQSVKALIARDLVGLEERLQHTTYEGMYDPKQWEEQRTLLRQATNLTEKSDFLTQMSQEDAVLISIEQQLSGMKRAAEQLLAEHTSHIERLTHQKHEDMQSLTRLEAEHLQTMSQLEPSLSQAKADQQEKRNRIRHLEHKRDAYQQQNVEGLQLQANRLEGLQAQHLSQQVLVSELEQNFSHITHLYAQRRSALTIEWQEEQAVLRQSFDTLQDTLRQRKEQARDDRDLSLSQLDRVFEQQLADSDAVQRQQHGEIMALQERMKHPTSDEANQLIQQITQIRQDIDRVQGEWVQATQQEKQQDQQHRALIASRDDSLRHLNQAKQHQHQLETQREGYEVSLKHVDSMLYFRLLAASPQQADVATRSLREELLTMPVDASLSVEVGNVTLLGCDLDLSQITPIEVLDRQRLEQGLQTCLQALFDAQQTQMTLGHSLSQLEKTIKQTDEAGRHIATKIKQLTYQMEQLKQQLSQAEQQLALVQGKLHHALTIALEAAKSQLTATKQAHHAILEARQHKRQAIEASYQQQLSGIGQEQQQARADVEQQLARLQDRHDASLAELGLAQRQELDQAGADTQEIEQQKARLSLLMQEIKAAQSARDLVTEYRLWFDEHFSAYPTLVAEEQSLRGQIMTLEHQIQSAYRAHQQAASILTAQIADHDKALVQARQEVQLIGALLQNALKEVVTAQALPTVMPVSSYQLQQQMNQLLEAYHQHDRDGQNACAKIFNSLKQTRELGAKVSEALESQGLDDLESVKHWRKHLPSLTYLLGDYLQGLIEDIQQQFALLSQKLIDLNRSLDDQARRIKEKGRQISNRMNEMGTAFAQVERIEAHISSSIDQIGFKRSLQKAASIAEEVQRLPAHDPLPENYLDAVSRAIVDIDHYGKHLNIEQFIEIAIEVKNKGQVKSRMARNDKELNNIDSEGLSFLILLTLYMAIKNTMQRDSKVTLLWAIDELGKLHHENIEALMTMLKREQVDFLCAEPHTNPKVLSLFKHIYTIQKTGRVQKIDSQLADHPAKMFLRAVQ